MVLTQVFAYVAFLPSANPSCWHCPAQHTKWQAPFISSLVGPPGSGMPGSVSNPSGPTQGPSTSTHSPFSPKGQGCPAFWGDLLRQHQPGVAEATRSPGQPTCCCSNAMLSKLSAAATAPPRQDLGLLEAPSPARAEKSEWPKDRNMGRHKRVFVPPTIKQLQGKGFASTHTIHSSEWNDFCHVPLLLTITCLAF